MTQSKMRDPAGDGKDAGPASATGCKGVVAAGDARTAAGGARLLSEGGNAVDAAIASVLCAFVTEPVLTGPFGGGLGMVAGPTGRDAVAWSFFANVPGLGLGDLGRGAPTDFLGAECCFGPTTQVFHIGRAAVAVPVLLPGLLELHRRHGRKALHELCVPALEYARSGVPLSGQIAPLLRILEPILRHTPEVERLFAPNGPLLETGEVFSSPDLEGLLDQVATGDPATGKDALLAAFGPPAASMTSDDLVAATPSPEAPIVLRIEGREISFPPPPASGGLLVAFSLSLMKTASASFGEDETEMALHLLAAIATAAAARKEGLDDALYGDSSELVERFLSPEHVESWIPYYEQVVMRGLPDDSAQAMEAALGSTTHVSVIDKDGMACSITHSNGEGCGHLVPGMGAMANNFLGEEDLHPKGFHRMPSGSRLTTMMCPTVVTKDGRAELAMGSGGSNRIRSAILQVLARRLWCGMPLEQAVRLPRIHLEGRVLYLERRSGGYEMPLSTIEALASRVDRVVAFDSPSVYFGGVHAVAGNGEGAGDLRRGGAVTCG